MPDYSFWGDGFTLCCAALLLSAGEALLAVNGGGAAVVSSFLASMSVAWRWCCLRCGFGEYAAGGGESGWSLRRRLSAMTVSGERGGFGCSNCPAFLLFLRLPRLGVLGCCCLLIFCGDSSSHRALLAAVECAAALALPSPRGCGSGDGGLDWWWQLRRGQSALVARWWATSGLVYGDGGFGGAGGVLLP